MSQEDYFNVGKCDCGDPECESFKVYTNKGLTVGCNMSKDSAEAVCATLNYMAGADNWHRFHKLVNELRLKSTMVELNDIYKKYRE